MQYLLQVPYAYEAYYAMQIIVPGMKSLNASSEVQWEEGWSSASGSLGGLPVGTHSGLATIALTVSVAKLLSWLEPASESALDCFPSI